MERGTEMKHTPGNMSSLTEDCTGQGAASRRPVRAARGFAVKRDTLMFVASVVALLAAAGLMGWQIFGGPSSPAAMSRQRNMICSETGEAFPRMTMPENPDTPTKNPKTGRATLYPAETCYWTKDGSAKTTPTYVLLNGYTNKEGPTKCPDCGRTVVGHNPAPPVELMLKAAEREGEDQARNACEQVGDGARVALARTACGGESRHLGFASSRRSRGGE